jgi:hypothetical protein
MIRKGQMAVATVTAQYRVHQESDSYFQLPLVAKEPEPQIVNFQVEPSAAGGNVWPLLPESSGWEKILVVP